MPEKYEIKQIHHNRCVVIPAEHLALAGIDKGGYVTVKVEGGEIRLQKVKLCQHPNVQEDVCCYKNS
jgi:bifunctional DNA-binding transcriptional regulator/antitoxin component of YhaV-PrlF toxin-antitoxin module